MWRLHNDFVLRHIAQKLRPEDYTGLLLTFLYCWTLKMFRDIYINSLSYHVKFMGVKVK